MIKKWTAEMLGDLNDALLFGFKLDPATHILDCYKELDALNEKHSGKTITYRFYENKDLEHPLIFVCGEEIGEYEVENYVVAGVHDGSTTWLTWHMPKKFLHKHYEFKEELTREKINKKYKNCIM